VKAQPRSAVFRSRALRHPFDTAWGTLAVGFLLTAVLVAALRFFSG